ncbi:MAG: type II toxin-antitoxin system prevent-host-death family antitoxin [Bacteroidetes bacterium]|nr:MAG: type II toxin-antitoxin system prevent-host-death family antitoxin [Bacteroidota bacterium]
MNADTVKIELIDWIARLNDQYSINKIVSLKKDLSAKINSDPKIFGSGKHLIEYISDDFNEPIDDFKEYQK